MLDRDLYKTWLTLTLLLFAVTGVTAQNQIIGIEMKHVDDNTLVSIHGSGPVRIAHQSVEAKEGKPFRIVIDCLDAQHALPQFDYQKLPKSLITSIRTSQYSVKPEEVVRVVMDLADESVYRIETADNVANVYVNDPSTTAFESWKSFAAATPVNHDVRSDEEGNAGKLSPEEVKTLASTDVRASDNTHSDESKIASRGLPVPIQYKDDRPEVKQDGAQDVGADQAEKVPSVIRKESSAPTEKALVKTDVASQSVPKASDQDHLTGQEKPVKQPLASVIPPATKTKESVPDQEAMKSSTKSTEQIAIYGPIPPVESKPEEIKAIHESTGDGPAVASTSDDRQPPAPGRIPGVAKDVHKDPETGQDQPEALSHGQQIRPQSHSQTTEETSRYRRSGAKSPKLRQTEVVQFPQRMVIKYDAGTDRDPFQNLIAVVKGSGKGRHALLTDRIPNVEALRLVGLLKSVQGKRAALMEDLDGIGYILKPGGQVQNGHVAEITDDAIYFQVKEYGWTRTVTRTLENE